MSAVQVNNVHVVHDCPFNRANCPEMIGQWFPNSSVPSYVSVRYLERKDVRDEMVSYVVDDAGAGRKLNDDPHAIVRVAGDKFKYASRLVGWYINQDTPVMIVAVHSYLDVAITDDEAVEMAKNYLEEIGYFEWVGQIYPHDFLF